MVNWDQFRVCNNNSRLAFEEMCRMLFRHRYFSTDAIMIVRANNPGIEVEPLLENTNKKRISFQAKFFDDKTNYQQILHSAEKTVDHYAGQLDCVYLYCNKNISIRATDYVKARNLLEDNNIELIPICGDEILDQVKEDKLAEHTYFDVPLITNDWVKKNLSLSLASMGKRHNGELNIETDTQRKFDLFLCNNASVDIFNELKNDVVERLTHYANTYGAGRFLARKLLSAIAMLTQLDANNLQTAYNWCDVVKQKCADEIAAANEKIKSLQEQYSELEAEKKHAAYPHDIDDIQMVFNALEGLRIEDTQKNLAQSKVLLISGDAGTGKSQMFAEAAKKCVEQSDVAILLLGNSFLNDRPIDQQMMDILELGCTFGKFLDKLEGMAESADKYSYIMIDALNECGNKKVWMNNIAQLIYEISSYNRIKLAISLRTGYEKILFSDRLDTFVEKGIITKLYHKGFWDNSVSAIHKFMNYYKIPFMPVYALSSELKNPLFLNLFCQNYTGEMVNLEKLIDTVINNADEEIRNNIGKEEADPFLGSLVTEYIELRLQKGYLSIKKDDLLVMDFWKKYGLEGNKTEIISLMVKANLLTTRLWDDVEYYSFTYQKIEDVLCAKYIFDKYKNKDALVEYVVSNLLEIKNGEIGIHTNIDIAVEVCALSITHHGEDVYEGIVSYLTDAYDSNAFAELFFRTFSQCTHTALSSEYVEAFLKKHCINADVVFDVFIENSTKEKHPLNADLLHKILLRQPLAHRDYVWTTFINNRTGEEDRLYQLLECFEKGELFSGVSKNNAELFLTLVTWLFTSSNRHLRDKATKVAVEILKRQFNLSNTLLDKFSSVDDPYVVERLYCSIYGACLKRIDTDMETYTNLIQYIYENLFLAETVYPDALVRDYARSIIERWIYENGGDSANIEIAKIRPPYCSEPIPTVEAQVYSEPFGSQSGMSLIDHSMRVNAPGCPGSYGDFGRYTFQSTLEYFENIDIVNLYHYAMQYIRDTLGYKNEYFNDEDRFCYNFSAYCSQRVSRERIGKKYQWIALHHILSRIADHTMVNRYGERGVYSGPWNPHIRDIDPSWNMSIPLSSNPPVFPSFKVAQEEFLLKKDVDQSDIDKWCKTQSSLHRTLPKRMILKDSDNQEWVVLLRFETEEIKLDDEKAEIGYSNGAQKIWAYTQGYFVKQHEKNALIQEISKIISNGKAPALLDGPTVYELFNREYPWAPGVKEKLKNCWHTFEIETGNSRVVESEDSLLRIIMQFGENEDEVEVTDIPNMHRTEKEMKTIGELLPVEIRVLQGERPDASSSGNRSYNIPCNELLESLDITQQQDDGIFASSGEIVAFDPSFSHGFDGLVIKKKYLDRFLEEKQYNIIWYVYGEKQYFQDYNKQTWLTRRGLFYVEENEVRVNWGYSCSEHSR